MANDVLKVLHDMEKELAEIKSAKEQVEAVVAADKTINKNLESYSSSLSDLSSKFRDVENSLKDVAKAVCEESGKFSSSLNERKNDIENVTKRLSELLEDFKKQTETLGIKTIAERTEMIHSSSKDLAEKADELLKELKSSQKTQDESLASLKTGQTNLSTKSDDITSTCKEISKSLIDTSEFLETKITDESKKAIDQVKKNCKENADKLNAKLTTIEAKIDTLQGDLNSLKNQQETTSKKIMKNVNINRWIIIAGIVILTVLLFVCK